MFNRPLALGCLALALHAPMPTLAKEAPAPVPVDAAFKPAEHATPLVEFTDPKWGRELKRVAVTQFAVEFVTNDSQSARTSTFGGGGASVTARWALAGVGEAEFQAAADAFHTRFLRDLAASGLEVVPHEQVLGAAVWKKFAAGGKPYPQRNDSSVVVAPPGMASYGTTALASTASNPSRGGVMGLIATVQGIGSVASTLAAQGDSAQLQKDLGGAALLEVHMRVHFVALTDENKGFLGRMAGSARVSAKPYPSVLDGSTVTLHRDGGIVNLQLKAPLQLEANAFASVQDQTATADPARWREVVDAGLGSAGQLFVERLRAAR